MLSRLSTSAKWIPVKGGGSGDRIEIRKQSGGQIQMQRAGTISSVTIDLIKLN